MGGAVGGGHAAEWRLDFAKRETLETNLKDHEEEPDTSGDDVRS